MDLLEKDYFGLQYTDPYNIPHWLDPSKPIKKQVKSKFAHAVIFNLLPLFFAQIWGIGIENE